MPPRKKQTILDDFISILETNLKDTGKDFAESARSVAQYASERAAHLSALTSDPDFMDAVKTERDNVALRAGIAAADQGDHIDARINGILQASLAFGARLLA